MAISSTYYIDTADFSTATAVWTDTALTTKAPDGYYSFGGNYRQQLSGNLLPIASCSAPPVGCTSYTFVASRDGSLTYTECNGTPHSIDTSRFSSYTFCAISNTVDGVGGTLFTNDPCTV